MWKLLDKSRRHYYIKFELKRRLLKSIKKNCQLPLNNRYFASFQLTTLPLKSAFTKPRNRCLYSGRKWNVLKKTQSSRFFLRREANRGYLPGVGRSSW